MQLAELLILQLAMFLFSMNQCSVLNKITLVLMQYHMRLHFYYVTVL